MLNRNESYPGLDTPVYTSVTPHEKTKEKQSDAPRPHPPPPSYHNTFNTSA
jgi:hypothetical protein